MKKSKSMKVAEYFLKYPNAVPKDVGAKFKMHMPQVYGIRKRVLSGALDSVLPDVVNPQITDAVPVEEAKENIIKKTNRKRKYKKKEVK